MREGSADCGSVRRHLGRLNNLRELSAARGRPRRHAGKLVSPRETSTTRGKARQPAGISREAWEGLTICRILRKARESPASRFSFPRRLGRLRKPWEPPARSGGAPQGVGISRGAFESSTSRGNSPQSGQRRAKALLLYAQGIATAAPTLGIAAVRVSMNLDNYLVSRGAALLRPRSGESVPAASSLEALCPSKGAQHCCAPTGKAGRANTES